MKITKPSGPTNPETQKLIAELKKKKEPFYSGLAKHLAKSRRRKEGVNLSKIGRFALQGEAVVVPGKVLAGGTIAKPVRIYALSFSKEAENKIRKAGGKAMGMHELLESKEKARILV